MSKNYIFLKNKTSSNTYKAKSPSLPELFKQTLYDRVNKHDITKNWSSISSLIYDTATSKTKLSHLDLFDNYTMEELIFKHYS
mgnify:CR=1 FL=1